MNPIARRVKLIIQRLPEETLVYDLERHRAMCLGSRIALIWRQCNGARGVGEIASLVRHKDPSLEDRVVLVALRRLSKANLLQEAVPGHARGTVGPRRDLLRKMAAIGGLSLLSISVPTPAMAVSCFPVTGGVCNNTPNTQCTGCRCSDQAGKCCVAVAGQPKCKCVVANC